MKGVPSLHSALRSHERECERRIPCAGKRKFGPLVVGRPTAAELAAELSVSHRLDGSLLARAPIGTNAFVAGAIAACACNVVAHVDRLEALLLPAQSQWCISRLSFAHRLANLCRMVPWERLSTSTRLIEQAFTCATASIFCLNEDGRHLASIC